MTQQRYRLRAWFPEREDQVAKKHLTLKCKVCAMARAMDMAENMEANMGRAPGSAKWTVERIDGHLNGWVIVARSEHIPGAWVRRHGH
jgi:hypothetical protein